MVFLNTGKAPHSHPTEFLCHISHGKAPVDGIGGAVKWCVWTSVKQRKEMVVNCACSFVEVAGGMPEDCVL